MWVCKLNPFSAPVHPAAKLIPVPVQGGGVVQLEVRGAVWMALPFLSNTDCDQVKQIIKTCPKILPGTELS